MQITGLKMKKKTTEREKYGSKISAHSSGRVVSRREIRDNWGGKYDGETYIVWFKLSHEKLWNHGV